MCPDFRGGAKKQPVPWPGGPGYNGAYVYVGIIFFEIKINKIYDIIIIKFFINNSLIYITF